MGKGEKKNALALILLLLAVILLTALYILLSEKKEKEEKKSTAPDSTSVTLSNFNEEDINEIYYKNSEAEMTLVREEKKWKQKEDPDFPVNQSHVSEMLSAAKQVTATGVVVKQSDNLGDYGLDSPQSTFRVRTKDGKEVAYSLGGEVPYEGGYYLCEKGKNAVYTVSPELYNAFTYTSGQMIEMEKTPVIAADTVNRVKIEGRKKELEFKEEKDSSWKIKGAYDSPVQADSGKVSTLLNSFISFPLIECVDYKGNDLKKYGLENPAHIITVDYEDKKTFHVSVGEKDEKGNYYVIIKDSDRVYTMAEDTVDQMVGLKAFDYVASAVNTTELDKLKALEVEKAGKSIRIEAAQGKKKEYTRNGEKVPEEKIKSVYEKLLKVTFTGEAKKGIKQSDAVIVMRITDTENQTVTVEYMPYEENHYLVKKDGNAYFLADKRTVDDVVNALFLL